MTDIKALNHAIDDALRLSLPPVAVKAVVSAQRCLENPNKENRDNAELSLHQVICGLPTGRVRLKTQQAVRLAVDYCDEKLNLCDSEGRDA